MRTSELQIIDTLRDTLERFPGIVLAILYGSFAHGRQRPDSDIDLAVAKSARQEIDAETMVHISLACSDATGREVQVRDLARAQGVFLRQVLTTGTLLLVRDPSVRAELIIRMLDFTEDMLPNVRLIRKATLEHFIAGS